VNVKQSGGLGSLFRYSESGNNLTSCDLGSAFPATENLGSAFPSNEIVTIILLVDLKQMLLV